MKNKTQKKDPVKVTVDAYNKHAGLYADYTFPLISQYQLTRFVVLLPEGKGPVLDAGSGSGRDVAYLKEEGIDAVGIDLSKELIKYAKKRVKAVFKERDIRETGFKDGMFRGVWCCATLFHLPKKEAANAIKEFNRILKDNGVLYLSLREGDKDGFVDYKKLNKEPVYMAKYLKEEAEEMLKQNGFRIDESFTENIDGKVWINIFARKLGS